MASYPRPEISNLDPDAEYVEVLRATPLALAQREAQFLASTKAGATILGHLRRHSYGDVYGAAIAGIPISVYSEQGSGETVTRQDGSFIVSGVAAGHVVLKLALPDNLTVVNKSALAFDVLDGACRVVDLTAELNGRVRGRIRSAPGHQIANVLLTLNPATIPPGWTISHSVRISARPNADGTFELSGVPPGSYVLSAGVENIQNGQRHYIVTYYPGTPEWAAAIPIVVGRATQHDVADFPIVTE